jgi:hypothetical protein
MSFCQSNKNIDQYVKKGKVIDEKYDINNVILKADEQSVHYIFVIKGIKTVRI